MINIGIKIESKNIFPYMWVININKYETKKIKPLTYKELESFNNQTNPHTCGEELWDKNNNSYRRKTKVRNHWNYICNNRGVAHSIFNLKNKIPKDIPVVFYNDSKYDFHFIIRLLAERFEGQFECLRENKEQMHNFFGYNKKSNKKIIRKRKNNKAITYKLKFINSVGFMVSLLLW